ncbi:hypothetical protein BCV71DRAFT_270280, partial [Rhizopus microsporus]
PFGIIQGSFRKPYCAQGQVLCQSEIHHSLWADHHDDPVLGLPGMKSVYEYSASYNHISFYIFWDPSTTYSLLHLLRCFYPLLPYVASTHKWRSFRAYSLCISIFSLY